METQETQPLAQPEANAPETQDSLEQLDGVAEIGRFHAISDSPEYGFQLYGDNETKGVSVGFNISPREALLLGDYIQQNREMLERGAQLEQGTSSFTPENAVSINDGSGPEPIPANRSIRQ